MLYNIHEQSIDDLKIHLSVDIHSILSVEVYFIEVLHFKKTV